MNKLIFFLLLLNGCNSRLLPSTHTQEPKADTTRHEPYAVFDYEDATGAHYLVFWKGNILNGLDFTKKELQDVNIPTYEK